MRLFFGKGTAVLPSHAAELRKRSDREKEQRLVERIKREASRDRDVRDNDPNHGR